MCERFLFDAELQYSRIGKLSGGQKRRLNLLRVLMEAPNVLLLDEPTNDLDIRTLTILEDYLDSFDGIVAVVSHDRYFLDRTVRRIFAFEEAGRVAQYEGGYTDYQLRMEERKTEQGKTQRQRPEKEEKRIKGRRRASTGRSFLIKNRGNMRRSRIRSRSWKKKLLRWKVNIQRLPEILSVWQSWTGS